MPRMMNASVRAKDRIGSLADEIATARRECKLDSWSSFVEELHVPSELVPALVSARSELVKVAPARDMTADEVRVLYRLIAGLLETNMALQLHAQRTARLVDNWMSGLRGMQSAAYQIQHFANFRDPGDPEEVDDSRE